MKKGQLPKQNGESRAKRYLQLAVGGRRRGAFAAPPSFSFGFVAGACAGTPRKNNHPVSECTHGTEEAEETVTVTNCHCD